MYLQVRSLSITDLPQCINLASEPVIQLAGSEQTAIARFSELLHRNSIIGVVVASEEGRVLGFASVMAIKRDFLTRLEHSDSPGLLNVLLTEKDSNQQFLNLSELDAAHHYGNSEYRKDALRSGENLSEPGVHLFSTFSGWVDRNTQVKDEIGKAIGTYISGLFVASYHKEMYDQQIFDEFYRFFGLPLRSAVGGRILAGLYRKDWELVRNPGQPINRIFSAKRPTLYLTEAERRVVQAYFESPRSTQQEICDRLEVSTIKDHVESITRKVLGPKSFEMSNSEFEEDFSEPTDHAPRRGRQRWHRVLKSLEKEPENYRPWVTMPNQLR